MPERHIWPSLASLHSFRLPWWYYHIWQPEPRMSWAEEPWPPKNDSSPVLYLFWHLRRTPSLFLSCSVSYYRQHISLWHIRESACRTVALNQLPNSEMWVTYGPKWVWKRMLISWMLLSASEGGAAYVCRHMKVSVCVCVCFHMLPRSAGGHVRTSYTNSWRRPTVKQTQGWVSARHHIQYTTGLNHFTII